MHASKSDVRKDKGKTKIKSSSTLMALTQTVCIGYHLNLYFNCIAMGSTEWRGKVTYKPVSMREDKFLCAMLQTSRRSYPLGEALVTYERRLPGDFYLINQV